MKWNKALPGVSRVLCLAPWVHCTNCKPHTHPSNICRECFTSVARFLLAGTQLCQRPVAQAVPLEGCLIKAPTQDAEITGSGAARLEMTEGGRGREDYVAVQTLGLHLPEILYPCLRWGEVGWES